jgi:hypothetical protein
MLLSSRARATCHLRNDASCPFENDQSDRIGIFVVPLDGWRESQLSFWGNALVQEPEWFS